MNKPLPNKSNVINALHSEKAMVYDPVDHGLPVKEESITQVGRGEFLADTSLIVTRDTALYRVKVNVRSIGVTVIDHDYVTFALPVAWNGDYTINGRLAASNHLYMPAETYYVRGESRETLGVVLRRQQFTETIAALNGIGPEDVRLMDSEFEFAPAVLNNLRKNLINQFGKGDEFSQQEFDNIIFGLMADTYLSAPGTAKLDTCRARQPERIVRKAEERFLEAGSGPISLADLCAASNVSKSSLYYAFHSICGLPPLEYFRKRQLMRARSMLLNSTPERGSIKRVALELGLTEFGRFSVEYRRLFGESPSTTLNSKQLYNCTTKTTRMDTISVSD